MKVLPLASISVVLCGNSPEAGVNSHLIVLVFTVKVFISKFSFKDYIFGEWLYSVT